MKRFFVSLMAVLAFFAADAGTYKAFEGKSTMTEKGLVGLYEAEGKVYMEIPFDLMGRRMLMGTMVEACSDPLESNVGYQPIVPYVVCFERTPSSIHLCRLNESYVMSEDRSMQDSNISSVEESFKIMEYSADSTACLIDVSSYFISHDSSMDPIDPKAFNAAEGYVKRTGSFVPSTSLFRGFHAGDKSFSISVSNSYKVKAAFLGVFSSSEQSIVTSQIRRTFVLLPEKPMEPVDFNVNVGTYSVELDEFDENKPSSATRRYAVKWRTTPIDFYIDNSFPSAWLPYVYESIEEWNKAFDGIGIKDALRAKPYPLEDEDFDPSDIRYNCIRYNLSPAETINDSRWCDPMTGEMLGTGIVVNHGIAEYIKKNLILQTAAGNVASREFRIDDKLFGEALKSMLLRNLGHCLGLTDNMAGSFAHPVDSLKSASFTDKYGISSSVMDELPFNFVGYSSEDVEDGLMMFQSKPGPYDIHALAFLYGESDNNQDRPLFGERQKTTDFYDPRSMSFDLGADAAESVEYGFKGLAAVVEGLNGWIGQDDYDYNFREGVQEAILLQAYEYIKQVFVTVGGIYVNPKNTEKDVKTYEPVPKEVQRRHLLWALDRIDDLSFLDNEELMLNSGVRGNTGEFCQKYFTNFIFIQVDAMWLSEVRSSDPYTQEEALADVASHIWRGASRGKVPDDLQKYQQTIYVDNLLSWAGVRGNYYLREKATSKEVSRPDKSHIWYGFLMDTKKNLEKACKKASSPEAYNHYRYLLHQIEKNL